MSGSIALMESALAQRAASTTEKLIDLHDRVDALRTRGVAAPSWSEYRTVHPPKEPDYFASITKSAAIGATILGAIAAVITAFSGVPLPIGLAVGGAAGGLIGAISGFYQEHEIYRRGANVDEYEKLVDSLEQSRGPSTALSTAIPYRNDHAEKVLQKACCGHEHTR